MELSDNAHSDEGLTIPKPFAARLLPRSKEKLRVVEEQWEIAMKEGYCSVVKKKGATREI